jgi:hypothetical protein
MVVVALGEPGTPVTCSAPARLEPSTMHAPTMLMSKLFPFIIILITLLLS